MTLEMMPVNKVTLSMAQLAGLHKIINDYREGQITQEYYVYACKSICPDLKEWRQNELVVS